jgi:hypothetical protein
MIAAVLFDLDETLLDRTTSLRAFLGDQYGRFGEQLGTASSEVWVDRFVDCASRMPPCFNGPRTASTSLPHSACSLGMIRLRTFSAPAPRV